MTSVSFFVPGQVTAQGSKRHVGKGVMVDSNKSLQPWRDSITHAAIQAGQDDLNWRAAAHGPAFTGPVRVTLSARYVRPKSHYRTGKYANQLRDDAPMFKSSSPDLDKVARAALDAITASGLWRDDAVVAVLVANKRYSTEPGLDIQINSLEDL